MSELPNNWEHTPLSKVCERIVDGSHNPPKGTDTGFPMLSARNIQNRKINFGEYRLISESDFLVEHQRTSIRSNDVLMTIVGTIGRTAVVGNDIEPFALQRSVAVLRAPNLNSQYLSYALEAPLIQKALTDSAQGTAQKGVYLKTLGSIKIPLAPLPEQKRIADKLDSVLARVDSCRDRLDRLPALLKRFRQSILAASTSGRLTTDFRSYSENKLAVPLKQSLTSIRTGPFGSSLHKSDYIVGGIPIVNPMHIQQGKIVPTLGMSVDNATASRLSDFRLSEGDVIIGRRGEMGRCAVVTFEQSDWLCGTGSMVLKPNDGLDPYYLQLFLSSPATIRALEGESVGTTMVNLNQKILLALEIYYPPIAEQAEIVRRVEILFAFADRLEARLATARRQVGQLTPALLAKAFRGELVPQDPADEPATELLKRLAAQREAAPKVKRGRAKA